VAPWEDERWPELAQVTAETHKNDVSLYAWVAKLTIDTQNEPHALLPLPPSLHGRPVFFFFQNTGQLWVHEALAAHPRRTHDPSKADLFVVPLES
jgi:hypothetical protein